MMRILTLLLGAVLFCAGFGTARWWYGKRIEEIQFEARVQQALSEAARAESEARGIEAQGRALEALRDHERRLLDALTVGTQTLNRDLSRQVASLRSAIDAPAYDCLRQPYPADGVRLLSRPGGEARGPGG